MHTYSDIINYFQAYAVANADFQHTVGGRIAFLASDIEDYQSAENNKALSSPFMIAGFNVDGIDNATSTFSIPFGAQTTRQYNFNLAICKETSDNTANGDTQSTLIALDELAEELVAQIIEDRENNIDTPECCFLEDLDPNIRVFKTNTIGTQKALGIVLSFTFNFCR